MFLVLSLLALLAGALPSTQTGTIELDSIQD